MIHWANSKSSVIINMVNNKYMDQIIYSKNNEVIHKLAKIEKSVQIIDLTAIDNLPGTKNLRFLLVYLCRYKQSMMICLNKIHDSFLSLEDVFPGINPAEREVYDMFGIIFESHKDLRRILTDYGFKGFPLRKDFPLSGYEEIPSLSPRGL